MITKKINSKLNQLFFQEQKELVVNYLEKNQQKYLKKHNDKTISIHKSFEKKQN